MTTKLTTQAIEQSTYVASVSFADSNGTSVVPTSATWTLLNSAGTVVNGRQDVSITPKATVTITLSGNDLRFLSGEKHAAQRFLLVEARYNSDYGTGLSMKDVASFYITNLVGIG
jgi:hypothetical protein